MARHWRTSWRLGPRFVLHGDGGHYYYYEYIFFWIFFLGVLALGLPPSCWMSSVLPFLIGVGLAMLCWGTGSPGGEPYSGMAGGRWLGLEGGAGSRKRKNAIVWARMNGILIHNYWVFVVLAVLVLCVWLRVGLAYLGGSISALLFSSKVS